MCSKADYKPSQMLQVLLSGLFRAQEHSRTVLAPIVSIGVDLLAQDLHVFPSGSAVELIYPHLLPTHVVSGVVLDVEPEVSGTLVRFLESARTKCVDVFLDSVLQLHAFEHFCCD